MQEPTALKTRGANLKRIIGEIVVNNILKKLWDNKKM